LLRAVSLLSPYESTIFHREPVTKLDMESAGLLVSGGRAPVVSKYARDIETRIGTLEFWGWGWGGGRGLLSDRGICGQLQKKKNASW
jgi:hypothetical protein